MPPTGMLSDPRVAVIVHGGGRWLSEAIASIREREPVDVIAEDASAGGAPAQSTAPYVFPLDGADLGVAGMLRSMADRLDTDPDLGACYGDYLEFGDGLALTEVPEDPGASDAVSAGRFPPSAMFRRTALERIGDPLAGCEEPGSASARWAALARAGIGASHMGRGVLTFFKRASGPVPDAGSQTVADAVKYGVLLGAARQQAPPRAPASGAARVAVLIPCFNDGGFVVAAAASVCEPEPVEVWVVDDASTERETHEALDRLEDGGCRVVRLGQNGGCGVARNVAMESTDAPYVFPLDADDLAVPGSLTQLADALDADPTAAAAFGDIEELKADRTLVRAAPDELDPFRIAYVNEMPLGSLYRKAVIAPLGGWQDPSPQLNGYEDWDLWMRLAENAAKAVHVGGGLISYRYRLHASRMTAETRRRHTLLYEALRERHRALFDALPEHRRRSSVGTIRKALYPYVYGGRRRYAFERPIKAGLDAVGVWTRRR
jgi:glycosyltransferase involved in cell wall biosynthesis